MKRRLSAVILTVGFLAGAAAAAMPGEVKEWRDFPMGGRGDFAGPVSAADLLDKPAGKDGPVVVMGGHFYTSLVGGKRIRFLGVNFCFSACFPTHEQADFMAPRLAGLGINAVRFHHMDSQSFPNGIFKAGTKLEDLDPVAMDRLDYFIAALKKSGVYADLNLHVSRWVSKAHKMPGSEKTPDFDKMIDLFMPELIAEQKSYAGELLSHVNPYTKNAYANEPAVCMVEINNENSLFMWGGEKTLADLPEPFGGTLTGLWNEWLLGKYGTQEKLAAAWGKGAVAMGANLLKDGKLETAGKQRSPWVAEQHDGAAMTVESGNDGVTLDISKVTATSWHLQFEQAGLALKKGQFYTVKFKGSADEERGVDVAVGQDHGEYKNLGLAESVKLTKEPGNFSLHFVATADEASARLSFIVGQKAGRVTLGEMVLAAGGQEGLGKDENVKIGTVKRGVQGTAATAAREHDWYDFLQQQDQAYFTEMYRYLRQDLHVHCAITGTIGLGALGTMSQAKMDYVDAHAYWDHPQFPGIPWDPRNWRLKNTAMVDSTSGGTFGGLAAIRVWEKPFTVTEYNEGAPNEWQAEAVPMIATFAALQDWDAVYVFAWSHNGDFEKDYVDSYFDIKASPAKLGFMPMAARIFLGGLVKSLPAGKPVLVSRDDSLHLAGRYYFQMWEQLKATAGVTAEKLLRQQLAVTFAPVGATVGTAPPADKRVSWTANGAGTGQFVVQDAGASVFVGFLKDGQTLKMGPVTLSKIGVPFLAATLVAADGKSGLASGKDLLLTVMARTENTGMVWNKERTTVGTNWGKAPTRIEAVRAELSVPAGWEVVEVGSSGKAGTVLKDAGGKVELEGGTCWYWLRKR